MKKITLLLFVLLSAIGFSQELVTCGEGASFEPLYGNQGMYTYSYQSADGVSPLKISIIAGILGTGSGQDSFQIFDGEDWAGELLFYATDGYYLSGTEVTSTGPNIFVVITGDESGSNFDGIVNEFIIGEVTCDAAAAVCEAPTDLTATNITATTASLSWTENGTAAEWQVSITVYGSDSDIIPVTTNPYSLTDLLPNTQYWIGVNANCGSEDESDWSAYYNFTTAAAVPCVAPSDLTATNITATTAEFSWTDNNVTPNGWWISVDYGLNSSDVYTELNPFIYTDLQPNTEYTIKVITQCGSSDFSEGSEEVTFTTAAAEPCLTPTDLTATSISATTAEFSWTENGTATQWVVTFGAYGFNSETTVNTNTIEYTDLVPDTGYSISVKAICGDGNESEWSEWLTVPTLSTTCVAPTDLTATNVTATTADLSWIANGIATEWLIEVYDVDFSGPSPSYSTTTSLNVTGLIAGIEYTAHVYGNCSNGASLDVATYTFTTLINDECENSIALTLGTEIIGDYINATDSGVTSSCDQGTIADVWYSLVAPTSGNVTISSSTNFALFADCSSSTAISCNTSEVTGLTAATTYYVRVTDDALLTRSLEPGEFTLKVEETTVLSSTDYNITSIKLYPNPTKGLVIIDNVMETELQISVYDIKGRLLLNKKLGLDTNSVDLSNFNNGIYLLKMKSEFGEISKRVIKN